MASGYQDPMIGELCAFIAGKDFQSTFEKFFLKHAAAFTDDEEHKLEYMEIYNRFQTEFDRFMDEFMKSQNISAGDFMQRCKQAQTEDPKAAHYIKIILASMEYDAFVKLMKQMRSRAKKAASESKAESKDSKSADDKGGKDVGQTEREDAGSKSEAKGEAKDGGVEDIQPDTK